MMPGLTEREIAAAEMRRRGLLTDAERHRFATAHRASSEPAEPAATSPRRLWIGLRGAAGVLGFGVPRPVEVAGEGAAIQP